MLPLGLRNRLAELILDAFDDPDARATLEALDGFCADDGGSLEGRDVARLAALPWFEVAGADRVRLRGALACHRAALCRRARAATEIFRHQPPPPGRGSLAGLLGRAALLADAGLFFEVHELLEPAWLSADGDQRLALQGLIQVAVAFHHAANDNREGARSLLAEGLAKLGAARAALPLDTTGWEAELAVALAALRRGEPLPPAPLWPRPEGGRPTEAAWRSS